MLPKFLTTLAVAASLVFAQTFTECDPTKRGKYYQEEDLHPHCRSLF